jgi:hypothetical protein
MASASFAIASTTTAPASAPAHPAPAKSLFGRVLARLIAARAAYARQEIARHAHIGRFEHSPETLELFARD